MHGQEKVKEEEEEEEKSKKKSTHVLKLTFTTLL